MEAVNGIPKVAFLAEFQDKSIPMRTGSRSFGT